MSDVLLSQEQHTALYAYVERHLTRSGCSHTLRRTRAWLRTQGLDSVGIRANISKIVDLGGMCDCELLMNVTPSEWQARREEELQYPYILGEAEGGSLVSHVMLNAVQHELW